MDKQHQGLGRALGLGAISGLRSASGPASLARAAHDGRISLEDTPLSFLASPWVAAALTVFQAGEMVGDKLPFTPSRTGLGPLLGRAASGALVGAAVSGAGVRRVFAGALIGGGAAVATAFAGERLRAVAVERTGLPDLAVALAEDAVVLATSVRLLHGI